MTFGEKLAEARKEKGRSQEALAKQLFVTRQALSRWENNTAQPSLEISGQAVSADRRGIVDHCRGAVVYLQFDQHRGAL